LRAKSESKAARIDNEICGVFAGKELLWSDPARGNLSVAESPIGREMTHWRAFETDAVSR